MDYGDGKLNRKYQFNTKYRKTEMCEHLAASMKYRNSRYSSYKRLYCECSRDVQLCSLLVCFVLYCDCSLL